MPAIKEAAVVLVESLFEGKDPATLTKGLRAMYEYRLTSDGQNDDLATRFAHYQQDATNRIEGIHISTFTGRDVTTENLYKAIVEFSNDEISLHNLQQAASAYEIERRKQIEQDNQSEKTSFWASIFGSSKSDASIKDTARKLNPQTEEYLQALSQAKDDLNEKLINAKLPVPNGLTINVAMLIQAYKANDINLYSENYDNFTADIVELDEKFTYKHGKYYNKTEVGAQVKFILNILSRLDPARLNFRTSQPGKRGK